MPRCIRPGRTWLLTRRTTRKHFLLRPDADGTSQRIYWYTTAVLAAKFGIEVHAVQMLSTHIHEVVTDVRGVLPLFVRERNRALANAMKVHRRWPEEFFQRAPASYVELYGADAILKEIGYTLANCVEAGLVRDPDKWPGVTVRVEDIGRRIISVERPTQYFDPKNPNWPEIASLSLSFPALVAETYRGSARERLLHAVQLAISCARGVARKAGLVASSVASLMRVPFQKRSRAQDRTGTRSPTFATAGNTELTRFALLERRSFYADYRRSVAQLGGYVEWVEFPCGSWRWPRELALQVERRRSLETSAFFVAG